MPPTIPENPTQSPLLCSLSLMYDTTHKTTAQTAYGGTVNNWARAFATAQSQKL